LAHAPQGGDDADVLLTHAPQGGDDDDVLLTHTQLDSPALDSPELLPLAAQAGDDEALLPLITPEHEARMEGLRGGETNEGAQGQVEPPGIGRNRIIDA
jgi:hypothetical protein